MFAFAPNQLPSNPVAVAAVLGIDQKSCDRVLAECLKKILRTRACPEPSSAGGRAFIERMQDRVLLFRRQAGEFDNAREQLAHSRRQFGQSFAVRFLVVGSESNQPMIDGINDTRFARFGSVARRYDSGGDRFDFGSLLRSEEFELWRRGCFHGGMRVSRGGPQGTPVCGDSGVAENCSRAQYIRASLTL